MTTADIHSKTPTAPGKFSLPDPPEHPDDKMTSSKHLSATGNQHHLAQHLGSPDTTIVAGERYVVVRPTRSMAGSHYPDLLVAFDTDPAAYEASNGYIIEEQGKPPDFVLEIASRHTGRVDVGEKREAYERLGILEYWRFDETGQHHGTRLAGDRLVDGVYEPVEIVRLADDVYQGYSAALNLHLRWDRGQLLWIDPATEEHIATFESERERADRESAARAAAEAQREAERQARIEERDARIDAEARVRELEARLHQQGS